MRRNTYNWRHNCSITNKPIYFSLNVKQAIKCSVYEVAAQWVVCLTLNRWMAVSRSSSPIKDSSCFREQETLLSLFSTGWFQGGIRAWFTYAKNCFFHNQTKVNSYKLNAQYCFWNRPVLSKGGKVSCSMKQHEPLMGFEHTSDRLRVRRSIWVS